MKLMQYRKDITRIICETTSENRVSHSPLSTFSYCQDAFVQSPSDNCLVAK